MDSSSPDQYYTCKECGHMIDISSNVWLHECFSKYDQTEYVIVHDEYNRLFSVLKELLKPCKTDGVDETNECDSVNIDENFDQDVTDELIIDSVKSHPAIYDYLNVPASERTQLKVSAIWIKIAEELNLEPEYVKSRWEYLRKKFMKKKELVDVYKPSGSAAKTAATERAAKDSFKFYEQMKFMNVVKKNVPTTTSLTNKNKRAVECYKNFTGTKRQKNDSSKKQDAPEKDGSFLDILGILKENNDPRDGVDGFLLQMGELLRLIPLHKRLDIQIYLLNYVKDYLNKLNILNE